MKKKNDIFNKIFPHERKMFFRYYNTRLKYDVYEEQSNPKQKRIREATVKTTYVDITKVHIIILTLYKLEFRYIYS